MEETQITGEPVKEEVKEEEPPKVKPKIETLWWFIAGVLVVIALGTYYYRWEYSGKRK